MCSGVLFWAPALCISQILDGALTYWGMCKFGIDAEANFVIHFLMNIMGIAQALIVVKMMSICIIGAMCLMGLDQIWLGRAFKFLTIFYFMFAICPWTLIYLIS